jgi:hypothetical protein
VQRHVGPKDGRIVTKADRLDLIQAKNAMAGTSRFGVTVGQLTIFQDTIRLLTRTFPDFISFFI